jgi:hypothetical protein
MLVLASGADYMMLRYHGCRLNSSFVMVKYVEIPLLGLIEYFPILLTSNESS